MGCTMSAIDEPVAEATLVGGVGRTVEQVRLQDTPKEREAMVALEVVASRQTVYRSKHRKFKASGDLDFNSRNDYSHLRNLLDEPVGRFYLREFAAQKELPVMRVLVDAWVAIRLMHVREVSLEEVLAQAEAEDKREKRQAGRAMGSAASSRSERKAAEREEREGAGALTDDEGPSATSSAFDQLQSEPGKAEVVDMAAAFVDEFLKQSDGAVGEAWAKVGEALVQSTLDEAMEAVAAEDADALRHRALTPLANRLFRVLIDEEFFKKFTQHSEVVRYEQKFPQVYNAISHRDFDLMEALGKGSFGRVLRARKRTTGEHSALKVMSKRKILGGAESSTHVNVERNVVVTCDSPSVVTPCFAFQTSRALFLGLELLEGGTLLDAISNDPLGVDAVRFISAQVILGLEHLHKHGIIYRDLKPVNVMLDRHGNAVITDLGLCAKIAPSQFPKELGAASETGTGNGTGKRRRRRRSLEVLAAHKLRTVGTYGFRAPELLEASETRKGYGPEVDFWALGITVHFLLTSRSPFTASRRGGRKSLMGMGVVNDPKAHEKKLNQMGPTFDGDLEPDCEALLAGLLHADPEQRLGHRPGELHGHAFFEGLDWGALDRRELEPVYKPPVRPEPDTPAFDGLIEAMGQFEHGNVLELFGGGGQDGMADEFVHVSKKSNRLFKEWHYLPEEALAEDFKIAGEDQLFE